MTRTEDTIPLISIHINTDEPAEVAVLDIGQVRLEITATPAPEETPEEKSESFLARMMGGAESPWPPRKSTFLAAIKAHLQDAADDGRTVRITDFAGKSVEYKAAKAYDWGYVLSRLDTLTPGYVTRRWDTIYSVEDVPPQPDGKKSTTPEAIKAHLAERALDQGLVRVTLKAGSTAVMTSILAECDDCTLADVWGWPQTHRYDQIASVEDA